MKSKRNTISAEDLKQLSDDFNTLKPKPKATYTTHEALAELEGKILNAQALGFNNDDICEILKRYGLDIKPATLSAYLNKLAGKSASKKKIVK